MYVDGKCKYNPIDVVKKKEKNKCRQKKKIDVVKNWLLVPASYPSEISFSKQDWIIDL